MMHNWFTISMAFALGAAGGDSTKQTYPRPELLIDAPALAAKLKDLRILDVRSKAKYEQGHIPGAVHVDPADWARLFASSQDPGDWITRIDKLGVKPVVIYDDGNAKDAARIWWVLRYFRMERVSLLNGGWSAWKSASQPVSAEAGTWQTRGPFHIPEPSPQRLATKRQILKLLQAKEKAQLIDARSEGEHCGTTKLAKRGGAIPGSTHLEWSDALDRKTHKFKSAPELAKLLKDAGIDVNRPAITYCQSGGRAAVSAFTLELMGARDVANYYRSWSEWGNAEDTPVEQKK
jgi:thiosulfate/3-mercaptopyruvate sulfurtransferase